MNAHSVVSAFVALGLCFAILISLTGWGRLGANLLGIQKIGTGGAISLGLVLQCFLAGALNLAHLISTPILLSILAMGMAMAAAYSLPEAANNQTWLLLWRNARTPTRMYFVAVLIAIALYLIYFIRPESYSPFDDLQAYMWLPDKMLQLHHLSFDPFSQRRIINSLGFNYYLQDMFLTLGALRNLSIVDGGLGIITLAALSLGLSRVLGLKATQTLTFLLLAGLIKQIYFNLSFVWLACALFMALVVIASREDILRHSRFLQPLLLGGLGATATALKNNHIIFAVFYILIFEGLIAFSSLPIPCSVTLGLKSRITFFVRSILVTGCCAVGVLALWMIDLRLSCGTFFFPLLGHGYEYSSYHLLPTRNVERPIVILKCFLAGLPLVLLAVCEIKVVKWSLATASIVATTIAAGLATITTGLATGGDGIRRYSYPEIMLSIILVFPLACSELNRRNVAILTKRRIEGAVAASVLLAYLSNHWTVTHGFVSLPEFRAAIKRDFLSGLRDEPLNAPSTVSEYRAVQDSLPLGATAVEDTSYPYLFDSVRNTIYEASLPAMASPPPAPGWPIFGSGDDLSAWLLSHDVRYLIYSYGDDNHREFAATSESIATNPHLSLIVRTTAIAARRAHTQFDQLSAVKRHIYDDGNIYVLDLASDKTP